MFPWWSPAATPKRKYYSDSETPLMASCTNLTSSRTGLVGCGGRGRGAGRNATAQPRRYGKYDGAAIGSSKYVRGHGGGPLERQDRKSTRLNSSHLGISYAV